MYIYRYTGWHRVRSIVRVSQSPLCHTLRALRCGVDSLLCQPCQLWHHVRRAVSYVGRARVKGHFPRSSRVKLQQASSQPASDLSHDIQGFALAMSALAAVSAASCQLAAVSAI